MTEFEWRRRMRDLRSDVQPPAHVWSGVLSRIGAESAVSVPSSLLARAPRRRVFWRALATAAVLVVVVSVARMVPTTRQDPVGTASVAPVSQDAGFDATAASDPATSEGLARNPVLAATDAELRELQEQLQRALASEPDSPTLQRMLMRTRDERRRLLQYHSQLG